MNEFGLERAIKEIESLFSKFNDHFYNGELITPVITVIPRGRKWASGWCSFEKIWKSTSEGRESNYEINICAENIADDFEVIAEILLHEMVHLYNVQHDVQDTSRSNQYHNKHYKSVAEMHGLIVQKSDSRGFSNTSLNSEAKEFISTLEKFDFQLHREDKGKMAKKKQSVIRLKCPKCGYIARVTKLGKLICGTCNVEMKP